MTGEANHSTENSGQHEDANMANNSSRASQSAGSTEDMFRKASFERHLGGFEELEEVERAALAKVEADAADEITDFPTLIGMTTSVNKHEIARLYFYFALDCLVDLAYLVSEDFFARPQLYTKLGGLQNATAIALLRSEYGHNLLFPDKKLRNLTYHAIFGSRISLTKGGSEFAGFSNALLEAASAFAKHVYEMGEESLRAAVRTSHRPLKSYLTGSRGDSAAFVARIALPSLTEHFCYRILRNPGVAAVFGIAEPPSPTWPYDQDSNGDKLIEAIAKHFGNEDGMDLSRERINSLQRVAVRGTEALAAVLEFRKEDDDAELDRLIVKTYTWATALAALGPAQEHTRDHVNNRGILPVFREQ